MYRQKKGGGSEKTERVGGYVGRTRKARGLHDFCKNRNLHAYDNARWLRWVLSASQEVHPGLSMCNSYISWQHSIKTVGETSREELRERMESDHVRQIATGFRFHSGYITLEDSQSIIGVWAVKRMDVQIDYRIETLNPCAWVPKISKSVGSRSAGR